MQVRTVPLGIAAGVTGALFLCAGSASAAAQTPWWIQIALPGTRLAAVQATGSRVVVRTSSGQTLLSPDGGMTFVADPSLPPPSASRIAAPASLPGTMVAVAGDGTVWRRAQNGHWMQSLLLLPQSLVQGVPRVTSVTAFAQPLSAAVYLSTDGYSVLVSTDGGDDWIRANPGLPESVFGLSADSALKSVYAATSTGLWVHRLQAFPAPPVYTDQSLALRWVGIALVTVAVSALAMLLLMRVMRAIAGGTVGTGGAAT